MTKDIFPPPGKSPDKSRSEDDVRREVNLELAELLGTAGIGNLSPAEQRLLKIASEFMMTSLQQVRIKVNPGGEAELLPVNVDIMKEAARLSMAAAIECDEQLRLLRRQLKEDAGR